MRESIIKIAKTQFLKEILHKKLKKYSKSINVNLPTHS